jgi:hypothetical protein
MKHLASIQKQFAAYGRDLNIVKIVKIAIESDWWKKLTPEQQRQYILEHRRSKMRPNRAYPGWSPDTGLIPAEPVFMKRILTSVPNQWKKILVQNGVGVNSGTRQLPDMLRSRVLKEAFEDRSVRAVVGFERGGPMTKMQPAFMIRPSGWKEDKFNLLAVKNKDGVSVDPNELAFIPKERVRHSRRDWRSRSWTERITDIRMSAVIDKVQDLPYTVFAITSDPQRAELRQERSSLQAVSKKRDIEKTLVAKTVRPVFDYYSSIIQRNTAKLQTQVIPSFDEVVSPDYSSTRSSRIQERLSDIVNSIKEAHNKLSNLSDSARSTTSWYGLPEAGESIGGQYEKRKVLEFMTKLKELKTKYSEDYNKAIEMKKNFAIDSLTSTTPDYEDAYDQVMSIGQSDIAKEISGLRNMGDDVAKVQKLKEIIQKIQSIQSIRQ